MRPTAGCDGRDNSGRKGALGHPADAAELHSDALVWGMTLPIITPGTPERKARVFSRAAAAGVDFVSVTLAIDGMDFRAVAQQLAIHRVFVAERTDTCGLVNSTDDVSEAREIGKLGVGFQGTAPFEDDLGRVDLYYQLGVRHALMAYNEQNAVGCGCHVPQDTGLTGTPARSV